ncbi:MAG: hypothetical protein JSS53_05720 [Proteobacteria bacterium]|nr:hypothetical protein [Pseudomonadota bacterium]
MQLDNLDKHYVSDITKFLNELQHELPLSASQKKEIAKHQRIAKLRDNPNTNEEGSDLWEGF